MEALAKRIVELREGRGISNEKLAQQLGVSHKSVINWEKNRRDPSLKHFLALAEFFGVTLDDMIGAESSR